MALPPADAQLRDSATGFFLVEEETFTPPEVAIIEHHEGRSAMAFMANDMNGTEQYLGDYVGSNVLLWFWKAEDQKCLELLHLLNQFASLDETTRIISFVEETRSEMNLFLSEHEVAFPIIPNANVFGEMAYAADLGYPRFFLVNEEGVIDKVLPSSAFQDPSDYVQRLESIFNLTGQ